MTATSSETSPTADDTALRKACVSRVIQVPARYIFQAYARPELLSRWFGPVDYPVTHCESDFRVGGKWRMAMTGPDGVQGPFFGGTYLEIVPDRRIVYDNAFEAAGGGTMNLAHADKMVMTTDFVERDGATTVTVTILFATAAMKDEYLGVGMKEGILSGMDQLAEVARELSLLV
jgi:uncharacterized protein YndB with AHSA1/START domain